MRIEERVRKPASSYEMDCALVHLGLLLGTSKGPKATKASKTPVKPTTSSKKSAKPTTKIAAVDLALTRSDSSSDVTVDSDGLMSDDPFSVSSTPPKKRRGRPAKKGTKASKAAPARKGRVLRATPEDIANVFSRDIPDEVSHAVVRPPNPPHVPLCCRCPDTVVMPLPTLVDTWHNAKRSLAALAHLPSWEDIGKYPGKAVSPVTATAQGWKDLAVTKDTTDYAAADTSNNSDNDVEGEGACDTSSVSLTASSEASLSDDDDSDDDVPIVELMQRISQRRK